MAYRKNPKQTTKTSNRIAQKEIAGAQDFSLVSEFKGYRNKEDITNLPPGYLVVGSQNVLTTVANRIGVRKGYTLYGQSDRTAKGIVASMDWIRHTGDERHLRAGNGKHQYLYVATAGDNWNGITFTQGQVYWIDLMTGLSDENTYFNYTDWWDFNREKKSALLFVNGSSNIYEWSGGITTLLTTSTTAIKITGTASLVTLTGTFTTANCSVSYAGGSGSIIMNTQPSNGDTLTMVYNGTSILITFVNAIGATPGNVLIGATLPDTLTNLLGLLQSPGTTTAQHVAIDNARTINYQSLTPALNNFTIATSTPGNTVTFNGLLGTSAHGTIVMNNQPSTTETLGFSINFNGITATFLNVLGVSPGSILIGGTVTDTFNNTLGLLQNPGTSDMTRVAFIPTDAAFIQYFQFATKTQLIGFGTYATTTTLTKTGTTSWVEEGFYNVTSPRYIVINNNVYKYSGGESTTTITDVSPSPAAEPVQSVIHQQIVTTSNQLINSLPPTFQNNLIYNLKNQIYLGSFIDRSIYVSKVNDYKDFSFTTPVRVIGEGARIEIDNSPTGFTNQEDTLYVTADPDYWYQVKFTSSADLTMETLTIVPLKTSLLQGAQSQGLISKVKNSVNFVSFEPTLDDLGRVADNLATPQTENLSDPIKNDFDSYNFTDGHLFYFRNAKYLALPVEGIVRVFNMAQNYWEAPLFMPIGRFAVINGELYGHSSQTPETFKLFVGYNDNGNAIDARLLFSYQNFGTRGNSKYFNEFYTEGYIASNTTITLGITYEIDGCSTQTSFNLSGTDTQVVCLSIADGSLGKHSLGKIPLGGGVSRSVTGLPPKFRWIQQMPRKDFYEVQFSFSSLQADAQWELLACGPLVSRSMYGNNAIKK